MLAATVLLSCSCAQTPTVPDEEDPGGRMSRAADSYTSCVAAEAEKDVANPANAEDIAVAAHGRCWTAWDAYRDAARSTFSAKARSREEMQLAHDRTDAHLRQFERETRRSVVDRLVERTLTKPK